MQKLTFTNTKNESLEIGYFKPYILQNLIGLSNAPIEMISSKGYRQDGQNKEANIFGPRLVTFSVIVDGSSLREIFELRRALIRFLNPKEDFMVIYENDYTSVKFTSRVDLAPSFESTQQQEGNQQYCSVSLLCDNPYLLDVIEITKKLSISEGKFGFPLIFYPSIFLSTLTNKEIIINNSGDVKTPVEIQFFGASLNPKITNVTTGEFIKVNKSIGSDETLEITTGYGNKRVEIIKSDGTRENAFQYIDLGSEFWELEVGENLINYEAESGVDSAQVFIHYSNRYVGV